MRFSILMSVWHNENPDFLARSLESLSHQTLKADELILVKDGPLTKELDAVIERFRESLNIHSLPLPFNRGLGFALREGVLATRHEIICRMDSDDIARSTRFEKQIEFLKKNPEIEVLGGGILEFEEKPQREEGHLRLLPLRHEEILEYAKKRNPLNHMTVAFKKSAVLAVGNYESFLGFEDYWLWVRMLQRGARFANLPEILVDVRGGISQALRRGSLAYAWREFLLQRRFLKCGFISGGEFLLNLLMRLPIRLLPAKGREFFYLHCLRSRARSSH